MDTIVTLMIRLAYRKLKILKKQRRSPESSTWTQSIGCRYRIALELQRGLSATPEPSSSIRNPEPSQSSSNLLQMRLVHDSQTFDPSNSLIPRLTIAGTPLNWWQLQFLYSGGILGFALSVFAVYPGGQEYREALQWGSVAGLVITATFVIPFVSCSQRQLLYKLCTSFDFVFLYAQQIAAHVCLCDVLAWEWTHCCGLLASFLWTHWVLSLDTIPPVCKERLSLRAEFAVLVLVARMVMQLYFSCEMLLWDRYKLQNRLLLNQIWFGYPVKFYVMPFLFSKMTTVFIWCVRLVYRICTRKPPHELIIILSDVEFDYVQWKKQSQQQQQQRVVQTQSVPVGGGSELVVMTTNPVRHTSSIQLEFHG